MKRKNLKAYTVLAVLLSMLLTGGIFAYWASGISGDSDDNVVAIEIGVGEEATTKINLGDIQKTQGLLVPAGYEKTGSVSEIVVTYKVTLLSEDSGAQGAELLFEAYASDSPHELIEIDVTSSSTSITADGDEVEVVVTITLTEPENVTQYNEVAGKNFDITINFLASIS